MWSKCGPWTGVININGRHEECLPHWGRKEGRKGWRDGEKDGGRKEGREGSREGISRLRKGREEEISPLAGNSDVPDVTGYWN